MTDPVVAPKTAPKPVTTKNLAYELAEQHQLTKKQGLEIMEELVAPEKGGAGEDGRTRGSTSAASCCPQGPQSGDR